MLINEHDQVAFIAGGSAISEWHGGASDARLRGFTTGYYRNGFSRWGYNSTVNVERIEYIRGPLAATFGISQPGGVVNYITKRAQRKPAYNFSYNIGSYDYQDVQLGATGPVAKNLFYRVDFQYTDRGNAQDFFYQRTYTASTSFTWQISPRTSWMFDFEHRLVTLNRGHPALLMRWAVGGLTLPNGKVNTVAVSGGRYTRFDTFNARGPDEWTNRKISTFDTRFEHRFSPHLSLRINGQYYAGLYKREGWGTATSATALPSYRMESGQIPGRVPYYENHPMERWAGQADLLATFKIGATSHKLLLTMDASTYLTTLPNWSMPESDLASLPVTVRNLVVANPDWGGYDRSLLTEKVRDERNYQQNVGFLLSERMELLRGRVLLYASLRNDNFYACYDNFLLDNPRTGGLRRNMFNHTYGGVMHIVPGKLIAFVNRSTSFVPSATVDPATGELQDPPVGRGVEVGARGEILKADDARRALYWSASLYRVDRRVPQVNSYYTGDEAEDLDASIPYYLNNGIERVDGVEFELSGNVSKEFSITLTYTKLDAFIKSYANDPKREGVRMLGVPEESISATVRHRVSEGRMRGFSTGLSMRYNSEYFSRYGMFASQVIGVDSPTEKLRLNYGPENSIEEVRPAVTLFDVFVEYEFRTSKKYRHTISLNIRNLNDTVWYNYVGTRNLGRQMHLRYRLRF